MQLEGVQSMGNQMSGQCRYGKRSQNMDQLKNKSFRKVSLLTVSMILYMTTTTVTHQVTSHSHKIT